MAGNKTTANDLKVEDFLNTIEDEQKRQDAYKLLELLRQATGLEPRMWGGSIIGFGSHHYKYASGREGDTMLAGFSPRKQNLTIYNMGGVKDRAELFQSLGKYTTGGGCLYIKRLSEVDLPALQRLLEAAFHQAKASAETPPGPDAG